MKVFAVLISVALIASVSAQNENMMRMMLMMRLFGGDSGSSSGSGSGSSPGSASTGGAGQQAYPRGASGGLGSLLGGGINPLFLMGGGDRMRDMMMCNMMQGTMRMMCMTRAFQ